MHGRGFCRCHASASNSIKECAYHLDLPDHLVDEARQMLGFKSNPDTIIFALSELVRRGRIEQLKSMMGSIRLDIDLAKSRRLPSNR